MSGGESLEILATIIITLAVSEIVFLIHDKRNACSSSAIGMSISFMTMWKHQFTRSLLKCRSQEPILCLPSISTKNDPNTTAFLWREECKIS